MQFDSSIALSYILLCIVICNTKNNNVITEIIIVVDLIIVWYNTCIAVCEGVCHAQLSTCLSMVYLTTKPKNSYRVL